MMNENEAAIILPTKDGGIYLNANLQAIFAQKLHYGRTRNLAASLTSPGVEYLAYLTQDATKLPGWLDALVSAVAADNDVAAAFSRHFPRADRNPLLARRIVEEWPQVGGRERFAKHLDGSADVTHQWHETMVRTREPDERSEPSE